MLLLLFPCDGISANSYTTASTYSESSIIYACSDYRNCVVLPLKMNGDDGNLTSLATKTLNMASGLLIDEDGAVMRSEDEVDEVVLSLFLCRFL